MTRRDAPATTRNRAPILEVLRRYVSEGATVLEIASGTGQHAAYLAPALRVHRWWPTDVDDVSLASIAAWTADDPRVEAPRCLDVHRASWPGPQAADAVVCINMIHISPWSTTPALIAGAARTLRPGGTLYLYGPYQRDGGHTAPSNERFEGWLKAQDPRWGVRAMEDVVAAAAGEGLDLVEVVPMPANNFSLVFRRISPAPPSS